MIFPTSLLVLALGLFATASPVPSSHDGGVAARDTVPNTSVVPVTVYAVFQILREAVVAVTPGLGRSYFEINVPTRPNSSAETIVASSGPVGQTGSIVPLVQQLTDALNTATASLATLSPGDAGAANEDLATLVENVLDVSYSSQFVFPSAHARFFLRT